MCPLCFWCRIVRHRLSSAGRPRCVAEDFVVAVPSAARVGMRPLNLELRSYPLPPQPPGGAGVPLGNASSITQFISNRGVANVPPVIATLCQKLPSGNFSPSHQATAKIPPWPPGQSPVVRLGFCDGSAWAVPVDKSTADPNVASVSARILLLFIANEANVPPSPLRTIYRNRVFS